MSKRPSLVGTMKPPAPHTSATMQSHNDIAMQLRDDEVPGAMPVPHPTVEAEAPKPASAPEPEADRAPEPEAVQEPSRKPRKAKAKADQDETAGMAHRSLYASPETLELIRRIAFEERISAQSLYREGLLLMLRKRGLYRDKTLKDV